MKTCAVIPAAGTGSRLGINAPKLLAPITDTCTVWSIMRDKLLCVVDHINIIIAPNVQHLFTTALEAEISGGIVSLSLQHQPLGMGDAVICGYPIWSQAKTIVITWGDQIFVSENTLTRSTQAHDEKSRHIVIPVTYLSSPYVEYIFTHSPAENSGKNNRLIHINQSREGDICSEAGFSDVGCFVLSVADLLEQWQQYSQHNHRGKQTDEINFLPFLPYLCSQQWCTRTIIVPDKNEARGINTPDDLIFFQQLFNNKG